MKKVFKVTDRWYIALVGAYDNPEYVWIDYYGGATRMELESSTMIPIVVFKEIIKQLEGHI